MHFQILQEFHNYSNIVFIICIQKNSNNPKSLCFINTYLRFSDKNEWYAIKIADVTK